MPIVYYDEVIGEELAVELGVDPEDLVPNNPQLSVGRTYDDDDSFYVHLLWVIPELSIKYGETLKFHRVIKVTYND